MSRYSMVQIDGAAVATRVDEPVGESRGDVVFCHGTPWSSQVWDAVSMDLSREYRVLRWDMPGYGESQMGPDVLTNLPTQARRLALLLSEWGTERPHVVAHDIGGAVALDAHLQHAVEYADLFLLDIVTLDPWGSPFFRLVAEHTDVFAALPPKLHAALVKEYITGAMVARKTSADLEVLAAPWLDSVGQGAFYRQIASLSPADTRALAEGLGDVRCATRVGWGREDPWIPLEQAYELQQRLPGETQVLEFEGVGHLTPYEAPDRVAAAVREWLGRRVS